MRTVLPALTESSDVPNEGESDLEGKVEKQSPTTEVVPIPKSTTGHGSQLAQKRVQAWLAHRRRTRREEKRQQFAEGQRYNGVNVEGFRRETQMRVNHFIDAMKKNETEAVGQGESDTENQKATFSSKPAYAACAEGIVTSSSMKRLRRVRSDPQITLEKGFTDAHGLPSPTSSLPSPASSSLKSAKQKIPRRRIAIVGGGPVGLWIGTLIAQRHYRRVQKPKPGQPAYLRNSDAPEMVIFEKRPPSGHCTRRNVRITLDAHTVGLLNKHTRSESFCSGMALSEIEQALLLQYKKICGPQAFIYEQDIPSPSDLFALGDWDLVLWSGGKNSLNSADREGFGCTMKTGEAEQVLVFEMRDFSHPCRMGKGDPVTLKDLDQLAATDLMAPVKDAMGCRVVLRCTQERDSNGKNAGLLSWLWLMGLPSELRAAKDLCPAGGKPEVHANLVQALNAELVRLGVINGDEPVVNQVDVPNWAIKLKSIVTSLHDRVLFPSSVSVRWVDAAFWSSDHVVCALPNPAGKNTPMALIGDAALGKPFFTGTTLNVHMAEVKALSQLPIMKWGITSPADVDIGGLLPYEQNYQELIQRCPGFRRKNIAGRR